MGSRESSDLDLTTLSLHSKSSSVSDFKDLSLLEEPGVFPPIDILLYILEFLDDAVTLCRCMRVSHTWHHIIRSHERSLWESLCHKDWHIVREPTVTHGNRIHRRLHDHNETIPASISNSSGGMPWWWWCSMAEGGRLLSLTTHMRSARRLFRMHRRMWRKVLGMGGVDWRVAYATGLNIRLGRVAFAVAKDGGGLHGRDGSLTKIVRASTTKGKKEKEKEREKEKGKQHEVGTRQKKRICHFGWPEDPNEAYTICLDRDLICWVDAEDREVIRMAKIDSLWSNEASGGQSSQEPQAIVPQCNLRQHIGTVGLILSNGQGLLASFDELSVILVWNLGEVGAEFADEALEGQLYKGDDEENTEADGSTAGRTELDANTVRPRTSLIRKFNEDGELGPIYSINIHDTKMVMASRTGRILVLDVLTGSTLYDIGVPLAYIPHLSDRTLVNVVIWGKWLAYGLYDGKFLVYDLEKMTYTWMFWNWGIGEDRAKSVGVNEVMEWEFRGGEVVLVGPGAVAWEAWGQEQQHQLQLEQQQQQQLLQAADAQVELPPGETTDDGDNDEEDILEEQSEDFTETEEEQDFQAHGYEHFESLPSADVEMALNPEPVGAHFSSTMMPSSKSWNLSAPLPTATESAVWDDCGGSGSLWDENTAGVPKFASSLQKLDTGEAGKEGALEQLPYPTAAGIIASSAGSSHSPALSTSSLRSGASTPRRRPPPPFLMDSDDGNSAQGSTSTPPLALPRLSSSSASQAVADEDINAVGSSSPAQRSNDVETGLNKVETDQEVAMMRSESPDGKRERAMAVMGSPPFDDEATGKMKGKIPESWEDVAEDSDSAAPRSEVNRENTLEPESLQDVYGPAEHVGDEEWDSEEDEIPPTPPILPMITSYVSGQVEHQPQPPSPLLGPIHPSYPIVAPVNDNRGVTGGPTLAPMTMALNGNVLVTNGPEAHTLSVWDLVTGRLLYVLCCRRKPRRHSANGLTDDEIRYGCKVIYSGAAPGSESEDDAFAEAPNLEIPFAEFSLDGTMIFGGITKEPFLVNFLPPATPTPPPSPPPIPPPPVAVFDDAPPTPTFHNGATGWNGSGQQQMIGIPDLPPLPPPFHPAWEGENDVETDVEDGAPSLSLVPHVPLGEASSSTTGFVAGAGSTSTQTNQGAGQQGGLEASRVGPNGANSRMAVWNFRPVVEGDDCGNDRRFMAVIVGGIKFLTSFTASAFAAMMFLASQASAEIFFSEDFEALNQAVSDKWTIQGNGVASIDTTNPKTGKKALKLAINGNGNSFLVPKAFNPPGNSFHGRMNLFVDSFPTTPNFAHWVNVELTGKGDGTILRPIGGQFIPGESWFFVYISLTVPAVNKKYVCFEYFVNGKDNSVTVSLDGVPKPELTVTQKKHGGNQVDLIFPKFDNIKIGWQLFQPSSDKFNVFIDDIALSTTPIGCGANNNVVSNDNAGKAAANNNAAAENKNQNQNKGNAGKNENKGNAGKNENKNQNKNQNKGNNKKNENKKGGAAKNENKGNAAAGNKDAQISEIVTLLEDALKLLE
ncbi:hypothetical protein HDU97_005874 [Phlyctochytrium planicorne]|nr:hypothetical protein HDU97_005874 [Phlyctochytrium planicorne]